MRDVVETQVPALIAALRVLFYKADFDKQAFVTKLTETATGKVTLFQYNAGTLARDWKPDLFAQTQHLAEEVSGALDGLAGFAGEQYPDELGAVKKLAGSYLPGALDAIKANRA